jgi:hypothetical protein
VIDGRLGDATRFNIINSFHSAAVVYKHPREANVFATFSWRWEDHEFIVVELAVRECDQFGMLRSVMPSQHPLLSSERAIGKRENAFVIFADESSICVAAFRSVHILAVASLQADPKDFVPDAGHG